MLSTLPLWGGELWEDGYGARMGGKRSRRWVIRCDLRQHRIEKAGDAQLSLPSSAHGPNLAHVYGNRWGHSHAANGGNIHYVPTTSRPHLGQHRQRGIERTPDIRSKAVAKSSTVVDRHRAHLDNASIVDHNINAPKTLYGLIHYRADLLLISHLTGDSQASAPRCIRSCRARASSCASRAVRTNRHPARADSHASARASPHEPLASQDRVHQGASSARTWNALLGLL